MRLQKQQQHLPVRELFLHLGFSLQQIRAAENRDELWAAFSVLHSLEHLSYLPHTSAEPDLLHPRKAVARRVLLCASDPLFGVAQ